MGMFNWVEHTANCPVCDEEVTGFQTKDGDSSLVTVSPLSVTYFYTDCDSCGTWIEFDVKHGGLKMKWLPKGESFLDSPVNWRYKDD